MALFAFEHLTFTYPGAAAPALRDVSLSVRAGDFMVLCGPSGCGKTTLVRHAKTALAPHGAREGHVLLDGVALAEVPAREQASRIGFVMQDAASQIVTDKVWHELAFGLESIGCDADVMRARVAEMASYFGIEGWLHRDVATLSGGQMQLLNLAAVMAMHPDVLVLDEPTSQLDPLAATEFLGVLRRVNQDLGVTVVLTEHRLEEVFPLADCVVAMDGGRIAAKGSAREVGAWMQKAGGAWALSMPTPLRVYCAVEGACEGVGREDGRRAGERPPLTVREGRLWLADRCARGSVAGAFPGGFRASGPLDGARRETSAETRAGWGSAGGVCGVSGAAVAEGVRDVARNESVAPAAESTDPALALRDVWFRYGRNERDVLRGLTLDVPRGKLFALMGGNGAGKSTLLRIVRGIARPYRGEVRVLGRMLRRRASDAALLGDVVLLPQDPRSLFVKATVREDLAEMLDDATAARVGAPAGDERIREVAALCDIEDLLATHPMDLSGGELQRAALAKVLLARPRLLLLDEPTKGLDCGAKERLATLVGDLLARGTCEAAAMVSHDIEFCARHADEVALLFDGEIASRGTPRQFFSRNSFYTTAASRMSRAVLEGAVTAEDIVACCAAHDAAARRAGASEGTGAEACEEAEREVAGADKSPGTGEAGGDTNGEASAAAGRTDGEASAAAGRTNGEASAAAEAESAGVSEEAGARTAENARASAPSAAAPSEGSDA